MTMGRRGGARRRIGALALAAALPVAGCTSAVGDSEVDGVTVLASFYPLQFVAEEVGGEHVVVDGLTPPGAEPHDLELAPYDVARMETAGLVLYLSGFQAAVDDAVAQATPRRVLDVADAGLAEDAGDEHATEHADEHPDDEHSDDEHGTDAHSDGDHAEDPHAGHAEDEPPEHEHTVDDGHGHGAVDPHLWLHPVALARVTDTVAEELSAVDPDHAPDFRRNADRLTQQLTALDEDIAATLTSCRSRTIVVAHEAYGHLADAYDLHQVGIAGLDPDTEPSPARLAEIAEVVRDEDVTTIFTESAVGAKVAETLAGDLGVATAVLDPLESLADEDTDYLQVMRENLDALEEGLGCR